MKAPWRMHLDICSTPIGSEQKIHAPPRLFPKNSMHTSMAMHGNSRCCHHSLLICWQEEWNHLLWHKLCGTRWAGSEKRLMTLTSIAAHILTAIHSSFNLIGRWNLFLRKLVQLRQCEAEQWSLHEPKVNTRSNALCIYRQTR